MSSLRKDFEERLIMSSNELGYRAPIAVVCLRGPGRHPIRRTSTDQLTKPFLKA
jgi:hypothetical protein